MNGSSRDDVAGGAVWSVIGRGSLYTIGTSLQLVALVVVLPVLTRFIDPSRFGLVATATVVGQVFVPLASLGLNSAITREYFAPDGRDDARRLVTASIASSTVLASIAHATGPLWARVFDDLEYGLPLQLAVASVPFVTVVSAVMALLRAQDRVGVFVVVALLGSVGARFVGIAAMALFEPTATTYLAGVLAGTVVAAAVGLIAVAPLPLSWAARGSVRRAMAIGLPIVPHLLAMWALSASDRVVIQRIEGLASVARYQVAYAIGSVTIALLTGLNNAWGPVIYGIDDDDLRWEVLARTRDATVALVALIGAGIAVASPFALAVAAPESYRASGLTAVIGIVAMGAVPYLVYLVHIRILFVVRRTAAVGCMSPLAAVINVALVAGLVPFLGLEGAAVATVLAYSVLAVGLRQVTRSLVRLGPWSQRTRRDLAIALAAAAFGGRAGTSGPWLVSRFAVAAALAVVVIVRFSALRRQAVAAERADP